MQNPKETLTEQLFWDDQYLTKFEATILEKRDDSLILDRTAFYPAGGGQFSDHGHIILQNKKSKKLTIKSIEKIDNEIVHYVKGKIDPEFKMGLKVIGEINWKRRYNLMLAHTSQHVLSAFIVNLVNIKTMKATIDETEVVIYLKRKISESELSTVLINTNSFLLSGKNVQSAFYEKGKIPEKIKAILRGSLVEIDTPKVRIVSIDDLDQSLCGGTHCKNTSEIGIIIINDFKGESINFSFGKNALERFASINLDVIKTSKLLLAKPTEVGKRMNKVIEEFNELKENNSQLTKIVLEQKLEEVKNNPITIGSVKVIKDNFHYAEKKFVLQELGQLSKNTLAVVIVKGPILVIVSEEKKLPADELIKIYCKKTNNKGGGTPKIAQAAIKNTKNLFALIEQIIEEKLNEI